MSVHELPAPQALVVDDEASICESLSGVLADEGWKVDTALSGTDGLRLFMNKYRSEEPHV